MNKLNLRITGYENLGRANLLIDGKPVKTKRNDFGNLVYKKQTESNSVKIQIQSYLDCGGPVWFILQICFFLLGIFGILDNHGRRNTTVVDFTAVVDLVGETDVVIRCSQKTGELALVPEENPNLHVSQNTCYIDNNAKRTYKLLRWCKLAVDIGCLVGIIIAIVSLI